METLQRLAVDTIKSHALRIATHSPRAQAYVFTEYLWAEEGTEQAALYRGRDAAPPAWLARLIAAQLADEQRHAGLIRARLDELGVTPREPPKLERRHARSCAAAARKLVAPHEQQRFAELAAIVAKFDRSFGVTLAVRYWLLIAGLALRDRSRS